MTKPPLPSPAPPTYQLFVGVDIAAASFTAATCLPDQTNPSKANIFRQNAEDFAALVKFLAASKVEPHNTLVVLEATGTYWIELATYLQLQHFRVSVINPKQAHNFAGALGLKPKNDLLDAQTLARLAAALKPGLWTPPPQIYRELYQRLMHRTSLLESRQQFKNQLHALSHAQPVAAVVESLESLIADLTTRISHLDKEIKQTLKADKEWAASVKLLRTITGIGPLSALWLVVLTLNFTTCSSAEALTHYAGLAPVERSSGTSVRKRAMIGKGGHSRLRSVLYMAAGSAMRFNPLIQTYCERLKNKRGKPYKVVRCAVARKLVHLAFAVVTTKKPFDPAYAATLKATV